MSRNFAIYHCFSLLKEGSNASHDLVSASQDSEGQTSGKFLISTVFELESAESEKTASNDKTRLCKLRRYTHRKLNYQKIAVFVCLALFVIRI